MRCELRDFIFNLAIIYFDENNLSAERIMVRNQAECNFLEFSAEQKPIESLSIFEVLLYAYLFQKNASWAHTFWNRGFRERNRDQLVRSAINIQ